MSQGAVDREQKHKNVLRRLYEEFVDRGNVQVLEEIVSPDFVSHAAKIAEFWAQVDRLGLLQQLGAVP